MVLEVLAIGVVVGVPSAFVIGGAGGSVIGGVTVGVAYRKKEKIKKFLGLSKKEIDENHDIRLENVEALSEDVEDTASQINNDTQSILSEMDKNRGEFQLNINALTKSSESLSSTASILKHFTEHPDNEFNELKRELNRALMQLTNIQDDILTARINLSSTLERLETNQVDLTSLSQSLNNDITQRDSIIAVLQNKIAENNELLKKPNILKNKTSLKAAQDKVKLLSKALADVLQENKDLKEEITRLKTKFTFLNEQITHTNEEAANTEHAAAPIAKQGMS